MKRLVALGCVAVVLLVLAGAAYKWYRRPVPMSKDLRVAERSLYKGSSEGAASTRSVAEDWPRWRGPWGDGISRETGLAGRWPDSGPPRLWTAEVGLGFASPVAVAGRVYAFTTTEGKDTLTCFDADSGKILWNVQDATGWIRSYEGTRSTPTIDGDRVYTLGGAGDLVCRNLADGAPVWTVNVLKNKGSDPLRWGVSSSPLVSGNLVYVQAGQTGPIAAAVDKSSGKVVWQSEATGQAGYAPLVVADVGGTPQLVVFAGTALVAMDPATGRTLWREPWETEYGVNGSTPIYRDGHLFVSSAYKKGCMMLRVTPTGATKLWENAEIQSRFQGMVLDGNALYANSEGTLKCMSWPDGKILWQQEEPKLGEGGSLVRAGDWLILMSRSGELTLARATPDRFEIVSRAEVFQDGKQTWSTPLIYGGRLYAKGETEFACFDVSTRILTTPTSVPASAPTASAR